MAGERRFRANELADNITIEAKILLPEGGSEISDLDSFKKAMTENLNREDMLPLEEARGYKKVLDDEYEGDPAQVPAVAKTFSKSVQLVNQRLALLALRPEIQAAVDLGHIGTQAAVQIAALSKDNQKAVFQDWRKGDKSDNQLVHIAYAMRKQEKAATQDSMVDVEEVTPEEKASGAARRPRPRATSTPSRGCGRCWTASARRTPWTWPAPWRGRSASGLSRWTGSRTSAEGPLPAPPGEGARRRQRDHGQPRRRSA